VFRDGLKIKNRASGPSTPLIILSIILTIEGARAVGAI
jgi:hypothetical protein